MPLLGAVGPNIGFNKALLPLQGAVGPNIWLNGGPLRGVRGVGVGPLGAAGGIEWLMPLQGAVGPNRALLPLQGQQAPIYARIGYWGSPRGYWGMGSTSVRVAEGIEEFLPLQASVRPNLGPNRTLLPRGNRPQYRPQ